jgi:hypothetical protein
MRIFRDLEQQGEAPICSRARILQGRTFTQDTMLEGTWVRRACL